MTYARASPRLISARAQHFARRPRLLHPCTLNAGVQYKGVRVYDHRYHAGTRARTYYSASNPTNAKAPYPPAETAILSAAMPHVPSTGFTQQALALGARDAGYLSASMALLPRGPFELVMYHNITQRLDLRNRLRDHDDVSTTNGGKATIDKSLSTGAKVRLLVLARLHANAAHARKYSQAIALMSLASNIPPSLAELAKLSDEIWYLSGDVTVDSSWYSKRGLLAGVYAATEVFMTQDRSKDFVETEKFLDRRLEDVRVLGSNASSVGEWIGFTGLSTINVLRSWGARI